MRTLELTALLLSGVALSGSPALAGSAANAKIDAIEQQIQSLQSQVQDLKASGASQLADSQRAAASQPKITLTNGRPTFASADGNFSVALRALVQFDAGYYAQSSAAPTGFNDLNSGTNFRRARIGLDGKIYNNWEYSFLYDFGGSGVEGSTISQAYVQFDKLGPFQVRAGAFPPFATLEDSAGAADTVFIERASAVEIARGLAGGDGRSAIAIFAAKPSYFASVALTGGKVGQSGTFDEQQAALARFAYHWGKSPDANIVVGVNGTDVFRTADSAAGPNVASTGINFQNSPELRVDDTGTAGAPLNLVSTGNINASSAYHWGVDGAANWKSLYAEGGYFGFGADRRGAGAAGSDPTFDGWYAQGSWVLTGEPRNYDQARAAFRSPKVAHPVTGKDSSWGAWEIAARYSVIDLDYHAGAAGTAKPAGGIRGGEQKIWTTGLNWYPNDALRVLLNYQHDEIDRLSAAGGKAGQNLDAVSLRLQISL